MSPIRAPRVPRILLPALLILGLGVGAWAGPPAAIPNTDPAHERAERSFNEFAAGWMKKMARVESENRLHPKLAQSAGTTVASYRGYDDDFQIELKPTGSASAPWVGILRYQEFQYTCADRTAKSCSPSKATRVTEIFRFQGGKWVY